MWHDASVGARRLATTLVLLVASCGPTPATSAAPAPASPSAVGTSASFVLANASGLVALDASCRPIGRVVELPPQTAAATPSLSPDRSRLAFALTGQPDPVRGFGSDIAEVRLDGTGMRTLVQHETENVFYASPRYDPLDASAIYAHRRAAVIRDGTYVGNTDEVVRVDLASGERRTILADAADPTISPDGRTIVFVHLKDALPDALWVASLPNAADARPLLRTADTFTYLQTPRFSPDGTRVAWSAAGRQTGAAPARGPVASAVGGRPAHLGIPSDLLVAPADGSSVTVLGTTGDDVMPNWSPDGTRIAYVGVGAMVLLTVADKSVNVCAQGQEFFFGDPVWVR